MKRSGTADLALQGGRIPPWLFSRMKQLSLPIVESIIQEYGTAHFLSKMSDPYWFQSFGAVIGMDWNSSGVTTAIMRALKEAVNPHSRQLGIYICGGKGKESTMTPNELLMVGDQTGLNGNELAYASKLSAKVDNTALQDGFNLYLHSFILDAKGEWTVVQQGMNPHNNKARRYHWHSKNVKSFIEDPHAAVCGEYQGEILNLVDSNAKSTQDAIIQISQENPVKILAEIPHMKLPSYQKVKSSDVDLRRLGSVLYLAGELETNSFEDLLMLQGVGPRTIQSLTLVSEVIHGTPSRFTDPARFAFAHGSKNGHPFAVPTKIYDESVTVLKNAVEKSRIGNSDKAKAIKSLSKIAERLEKSFTPNDDFDKVLADQKRQASQLGARQVNHKKSKNKGGNQLDLF
ncbi:MAG: DUF763 domain-containing protein [Bacteroidota bacterium]